jgi:hypothetical protein
MSDPVGKEAMTEIADRYASRRVRSSGSKHTRPDKAGGMRWGFRPQRPGGYARNMSPNHRRALKLLAASSDGCTEALFAANGLPYALIFNLIREGLAVAKTEEVLTSPM